MQMINTIHDLKTLQQKLQTYRESFRKTLILCGGTGCQASRSRDLINNIQVELVKQGFASDILVRATGCHGFCEQGPILVVEPDNTFYCHVSPDDAEEIVQKNRRQGPIDRTSSLYGSRLRKNH